MFHLYTYMQMCTFGIGCERQEQEPKHNELLVGVHGAVLKFKLDLVHQISLTYGLEHNI